MPNLSSIVAPDGVVTANNELELRNKTLTDPVVNYSTNGGSFPVPSGTTAERPTDSAIGAIRFNTDESALEQYDGSNWNTVELTDQEIRSLFNGDGDLIYDSATGEFSVTTTDTPDQVLKPVLLSPTDGETDIGESPTLDAGDYYHLYDRPHTLSRFQISDDDQFNNIVYDSGEIAATQTHTVPSGNLQEGQVIYYWRAYYVDDAGNQSEYSDTFEFTTSNEFPFFGANGGTVTDITDGGVNYRVHTFTSSGTFDVTSGGGDVEYLVVGGGGGGGASSNYSGGGGGAGGVLTGTQNITPQSYQITVGGGGSGASVGFNFGGDGGDSSALSNTAIGGGGGGAGEEDGRNGGSGGGGGSIANTTGGSGVSGQGFDGGNHPSADGTSAGGGGASEQGQDGDNSGGDGGDGLSSSITGSSIFYAGGGGGGSRGGSTGSTNEGIGGSGGGGDGSDHNIDKAAEAGDANTGGGGGGGSGVNGSNMFGGAPGGSGIVIIRYQI